MFLFTDKGLEPFASTTEILGHATQVFQGDFTVPGDKEKLVDPLLMLWARLLQRKQQDTSLNDMWQMVDANRSSVFPPDFFHGLVGVLEARIDEIERSRVVIKPAGRAHNLQRIGTNARSGALSKAGPSEISI